MKARIALVLTFGLLMSSRVEAGILGIFSSKPKLPEAVSPIMHGNLVPEDHKPGNTQKHPKKYLDVDRGSVWKQFLYQDMNFHSAHWAK